MTSKAKNQDLSKVSVVCISYNQEQYIKQAIESVCSQNYSNLEVVICDDASTDNTQKVILETIEPYKSKIDFVLKMRKKNIGIARNLYDGLSLSTGKYIALCEGDDYWTDIEKITKQTTVMNNNPEVSVCFHPVKVIYETIQRLSEIYPENIKEGIVGGVEAIVDQNLIQTNSVLYRRAKSYEGLPVDILPIDWYLHTMHALSGKIYFIDEVMAAYRRNPGGVWWSQTNSVEKLMHDHGYKHMRFFEEQAKILLKPQHVSKAEIHIIEYMSIVASADDKYPGTLKPFFVKDPSLLKNYFHMVLSRLKNLENEIGTIKHNTKKDQKQIHELSEELKSKQEELNLVYNSRTWRLRARFVRLFRKEK